jgi:hypothetical protein
MSRTCAGTGAARCRRVLRTIDPTRLSEIAGGRGIARALIGLEAVKGLIDPHDAVGEYIDGRAQGESRSKAVSHAAGEILRYALWGDVWGPMLVSKAY